MPEMPIERVYSDSTRAPRLERHPASAISRSKFLDQVRYRLPASPSRDAVVGKFVLPHPLADGRTAFASTGAYQERRLQITHSDKALKRRIGPVIMGT